MPSRRSVLSASVVFAGSLSIVGSGAFSTVSAARQVSINVSDDAEAYLRLDPDDPDYSNSAYATEVEGVIKIEIIDKDSSGFKGDGISPFAATTLEEIFPIENQGTQEVQITVESSDLTESEVGNRVDLFATPDPSDDDQDFDLVSLVDNSVTIDPGEAVAAGLKIDATGNDLGKLQDLIEGLQLTVVAEAEEVSNS